MTLSATALYAVLHCEMLFAWVLLLLPEFDADAPFV
jgi:hypothetical protein